MLTAILSPAAGRGQPERLEPAIRRALGQVDVTFRYPRSLAALDAAVDEAVAFGATHLAVGGGDGTINRAVNRLRDVQMVFAPLPLGSGNDFCRGLGLERLDTALAALRGGRTRTVDLVEVNGIRVCTVAGLGVAARAGVQVGRLGRPGSLLRPAIRRLGAAAYLAAAGARIVLEPHLASDASIRWRTPGGDWQQAAGTFVAAFLAVRRTLGAGLRLPIEDAGEDGLFEVVLVERAARLRLARQLPRLRSGRPIAPGILRVERTTEAIIDWRDRTPLLVDGEHCGDVTRAVARILPAALRVPELGDRL
ncbi:MAG TPA: diacylglycerol kinase family protein [Vicinamibacterales bacterium]